MGVTLDTETIENPTMTEGTTSTVPRLTEIFNLNPHAGDINPSSTEGGKLYMKATEELPENQKIRVSLANGLKVRDALNKNRSKFAWGPLLSKVPDSNDDPKDVLKNYRALTKDNIMRWYGTYLGNGNLEVPQSH